MHQIPKEPVDDKSAGDPVCNTCKKHIEFMPYRFLVLDEGGQKKVFHFHYFFPCWDMDYFCQRYPSYKIDTAGFVYDDKILDDPKKIQNIKRNESLWY